MSDAEAIFAPLHRPAATPVPSADERRSFPPIGVHLTPYAPGCGHLMIGDPRRWRMFWAVGPVVALKATLRRLAVRPRDCRIEREANGDVALWGPYVGSADYVLSLDADGRAPLAFIHDGLTVEGAERALGEIRKSGWSPDLSNPFED